MILSSPTTATFSLFHLGELELHGEIHQCHSNGSVSFWVNNGAWSGRFYKDGRMLVDETGDLFSLTGGNYKFEYDFVKPEPPSQEIPF